MAQRIPIQTPHLSELKKILKREESSNGKRLPSWGVKRDLSLSGSKPKKVYVPNLNAVRNKDKNIHVPNKIDRVKNTPRGTKRLLPNFTNDRNKQNKFVETQGVFSFGMGQDMKIYNLRERSSPGVKIVIETMARAKAKERCGPRVNVLDDSDEDESESEDELSPFSFNNDCNIDKKEDALKIKLESEVKTEGVSESPVQAPGCSSENKPSPKLEVEPTKTTSVSFLNSTKEYDEDNPAISLIRLPDSFLNTSNHVDSNEDNMLSLKDLPEGQIGKIIVRKSGKMEIIMQHNKNTLKPAVIGQEPEFAMLLPGNQSIAMEPSLVTLGKITEKFVLLPEWDNLFETVRKENPFYW